MQRSRVRSSSGPPRRSKVRSAQNPRFRESRGFFIFTSLLLLSNSNPLRRALNWVGGTSRTAFGCSFLLVPPARRKSAANGSNVRETAMVSLTSPSLHGLRACGIHLQRSVFFISGYESALQGVEGGMLEFSFLFPMQESCSNDHPQENVGE